MKIAISKHLVEMKKVCLIDKRMEFHVKVKILITLSKNISNEEVYVRINSKNSKQNKNNCNVILHFHMSLKRNILSIFQKEKTMIGYVNLALGHLLMKKCVQGICCFYTRWAKSMNAKFVKNPLWENKILRYTWHRTKMSLVFVIFVD